jgi:hypothetical protein
MTAVIQAQDILQLLCMRFIPFFLHFGHQNVIFCHQISLGVEQLKPRDAKMNSAMAAEQYSLFSLPVLIVVSMETALHSIFVGNFWAVEDTIMV